MRYVRKVLVFWSPRPLFSAVAAQADVKTGVDAWQRGDFGAAVSVWRPLADQGDPDAQYNLGQAYKMGRGVPADLSIAQTWYEKAAQQGHPQAAANLGLILFQNGEKQRAIPWLKWRPRPTIRAPNMSSARRSSTATSPARTGPALML